MWLQKMRTLKRVYFSGSRAFFGRRNATYVCHKHKYSRKGSGDCPICQKPCVCLGERHRIGKHGNFKKVERKTRKLEGQKPIVSFRRIMVGRVAAKV